MTIDYRMEGDVAIVTLDRPEKYNSVSADLSRGLIEDAVSTLRQAVDDSGRLPELLGALGYGYAKSGRRDFVATPDDHRLFQIHDGAAEIGVRAHTLRFSGLI